jgi:hypothetical protein
MTVATLREIREDIATAVSAELQCFDKLPAAPIPPFAVVMWPSVIEFDLTLSGLSTYSIPLTIYVSLADVDSGQDALDGFISGDIREAIYAAESPHWRNVNIESVTNIRPETIGSTSCLAADFNLTIIA